MKNNYNLPKVVQKLLRINFIPRWIVFSIDLFCVLISILFTSYIFSGMGVENTAINFVGFLYIVAINALFLFLFKVYIGVVRFSTKEDMKRVVYSQVSTFLVLSVINYTTLYIFELEAKKFLTTFLLITMFVSIVALIGYRFTVKIIFEIAKQNTATPVSRTSVVIYGVGEEALSIASAIQNDINSQYLLKGFIDNSSKSTGGKILELPVYNSKRKSYVVARKLKSEAVILADNTLTNEQMFDIVNNNLEYNIRTLYLPKITDFSDTKNIVSNIKNIKIQDLLERKEIKITNEKIAQDITGRVILVTGAAGSIGSEIAFQVLKFSPNHLILLDQAETPLHNITLEIEKIKENTTITSIIADIRNIEDIEKVFAEYRPQMVYHAAAYKHVPLMEKNPPQAIFTNVEGSKNLADLSARYQVERFVMVSTDKAVNPSNVMGASKRIAEKYVQSLAKKFEKEHHTRFITTRFGNVLGSNGSVVPLFTKQIEEGGPITITHPDIIRYFMTIPEACQLVLEAGSMGQGGEIYIFDMGKAVKILDLAIKMIKIVGLQPYKDIDIKVVGLRPGEKLYEELLYDTATTLPTYHEKIMIANDIVEDYSQIKEEINKLIIFAHHNSTIEVVKQMKRIAPEFISLNSEYSILDKK